MVPQILPVIEDPYFDPRVTLRPFTGEDLDGFANSMEDATLVVEAWPDTAAEEQQGMWAFNCWPGAMLFVPSGGAAEEPPKFSRIILASSRVDRVQALAEWVAQMAARAHSHLYLLVTLEQSAGADEADLEANYLAAQGRLSSIATSLRLLGIQANWEVRFGSLGEEVAGLAETTGTSVVAVERPANGNAASDFAQVFDFTRLNPARLYLLVSPPEETPPVVGCGRA